MINQIHTYKYLYFQIYFTLPNIQTRTEDLFLDVLFFIYIQIYIGNKYDYLLKEESCTWQNPFLLAQKRLNSGQVLEQKEPMATAWHAPLFLSLTPAGCIARKRMLTTAGCRGFLGKSRHRKPWDDITDYKEKTLIYTTNLFANPTSTKRKKY